MKTKKPIVMLLSLLSLIVLFSLSITASAEYSEEFTEDIFTYQIKDGKTATITYVQYDSSYTDLYIPETLGGYEVTELWVKALIFTGAYHNEYITIHIPKTLTDINDGAFISGEYTFFDVDKDNPTFANDENGAMYSKDFTKLLHVPKDPNVTHYSIPDGVVSIEGCCFAYNYYIKEIDIPSSVLHIQQNGFYAAKALERIEIPDNVTGTGGLAFASCSKLKEVKLSNSMTKISNSDFTECYALERIVIPEGVTELQTYAFENDVRLKEIYLPSTLKKIYSGALGNTKITDIVYGGTPEQWAQIELDTNSYYNNRPVIVDTATIHYGGSPASITSDVTFENENGILTVGGQAEIPAAESPTWRYWNKDSKDITTLIIDGELQNIGAYSFVDFPNLASVIVMTPSITFDENAFSSCPQLETVIIFGDSDYGSSSFDACADTVRVFQSTQATHNFTQSGSKVTPVSFTFDGGVLSFDGKVTLDPYEFLDTLAAFSMNFDGIEKVKFSSLTFENMRIYYISNGAALKPIPQNTLTDCEIYPSISGVEEESITFNELVNGISDGSITNFYLITTDGNYDEVLDPEINIIEEIREFIERALRWIVNLLNKLFKLISRF